MLCRHTVAVQKAASHHKPTVKPRARRYTVVISPPLFAKLCENFASLARNPSPPLPKTKTPHSP